VNEYENRKDALAAARKEGETDALLREHSKHLAEINGSVADAAAALGALKSEVHDLSSKGENALRAVQLALEDAIRSLGLDIRKLQEELRIRDERVATARTTLEEETERRRADLAVTVEAADAHSRSDQWRFTKWHGIAVALVAIAGLVLTIAHPWG
jgi:chromosome segregation ATPase